MTVLWLAALIAAVLLHALSSGSETGLYSLSRPRVEAEARAGSRRARWVDRLMHDDARLLITILISVNVAELVATGICGRLFANLPLPDHLMEIAITLTLTPILLFFGELLPKDIFRRRPHALVGAVAPLLYASRIVFAPLIAPLRWLTALLLRWVGTQEEELVRVQSREAVIELLRERDQELSPRLEAMARKVLDLRSIAVERVMVPWRRVETLRADAAPTAVLDQIGRSRFSRLPVVERSGAVVGYVHQIEVLAARTAAPASDHLRPITTVTPGLPIDRAIARLRASGQRAAVVGSLTRPIGLVTLKDLVEEISGELYRW